MISISRLTNEKTYRRVVTRNGPVPKDLEDIEVAVKISLLSHRLKFEMRSILDRVRMILRAVDSLPLCHQAEQSQEHEGNRNDKNVETRTNFQRGRKFMERLNYLDDDFIHSNVNSTREDVLLYVFCCDAAVIKMMTKGRSLQ